MSEAWEDILMEMDTKLMTFAEEKKASGTWLQFQALGQVNQMTRVATGLFCVFQPHRKRAVVQSAMTSWGYSCLGFQGENFFKTLLHAGNTFL